MLRKESIVRAIEHLALIGDTDILPPLFEFKFYNAYKSEIADNISPLPFDQYRPKSCFEVLSPKTRMSFRIAHQLYPSDTLLYTTAVLDISQSIEEMRIPIESGAYSYRFVNDDANPQFYSDYGNYHDWLNHVREMCGPESPYGGASHVIETDISDFYPRIYFHRIEHVLDDCGAENSVRKVIEGIIKHSRARQSHGLPVGTAASRMLAEGVLNDTDRMLDARGIPFARYVDDLKIIVYSEQEAHSTLCRLAEHLMLTEGLSLNAAKTKISRLEEVEESITEKLNDVFSGQSLSSLISGFS